jgi:hypothetical protein
MLLAMADAILRVDKALLKTCQQYYHHIVYTFRVL